jgi:hypothetical protein
VRHLAAAVALVVALSGCGVMERPQRPAWRAQAENVCLARKQVQATAFTQPAAPINGPGICGMEHPFHVTALAGGAVEFNASQTLGCPMTAALDEWVTTVVQPIAMARFGQPVARVNSMGSFSCRSIDNIRGAKLSEHSFGNATDVGGFRLADGHEIVVVKAWTRGDEQERAFLREVQAGACGIFTTVLAPGSDSFHYNHIHLDLAMHGNTSTGPRRVCKPRPTQQLAPAPGQRDNLPDAPDVDEELDVAARQTRHTTVAGGLDLAAPPAPIARPPARQAYGPPAGLAPPMSIGAVSARPRAPASGTLDDNGTFTPEGDPADWDATSSIPRRR